MNYLNPCTRTEDRLCDFFADLPRFNRLFSFMGLHFKELSPGQLSLVEMDGVCAPSSKKEPPVLLCDLLTRHHCIVSVHLNKYMLEGDHQLIYDALRESTGLTKLTFSGLNTTTNISQGFAAVLPQLKQLQQLVLRHVPFDRTSLESLSEFLASTRSLTTITMTDQSIQGEDAVVVLRGLGQNATITTLSLSMDFLSPALSRCGLAFAAYLRCNRTLRSLSVSSHSSHTWSEFNDLHAVTEPLYKNNTISELNLIGFSLGILNNKFITGMLSRNRGLRRFHMVDCSCNEPPVQQDPIAGPSEQAFSDQRSLISLWLGALAENSTLEELTLNLSWIKPQDCSSLFMVLARNRSLKKVNVPTFRNKDVAQICRALRNTGVPERFYLGQHSVSKDTVADLPKCKELSRIKVGISCASDSAALHTILRLLPTCNHVKSLSLEMTAEMFNEMTSSLAQYIANTTALRELRLNVFTDEWYAVEMFDRTLLQALSNNKSIRRLGMAGICINEEQAQMMADMLQSSRTLCHLSIYQCDSHSTASLLRKLSANVSSNYMLLGMRTDTYDELCSVWFKILDVVGRNHSLVTRAAHFVAGKRRNKYCAAAAELVQFNPALEEKVQELSSVDEYEAASQIKTSLKSLLELDDFMRVAGVVKCRVTCDRRDDGRTQLVDLNRDCWLRIRQFLRVDDIWDSE